MINNKKKINKIKTQNFLNEFSIKFLLQHNNFSVKDWFEFRQKIQEISEDSVEILNVKNNLLKKSLVNSFSQNLHSSKNNLKQLSLQNSLNSLCQGPNFLIGCRNENSLKAIWNLLNSNSKLLFICCFYKDQLLNHLDFETLLKTDFSIYSNLFQLLDKKTELSYTLEYHLRIYPLLLIKSKPISILENLKQLKLKK